MSAVLDALAIEKVAVEKPAVEKRVVFDFAIEFSNGGGLQGQGFRLDLHPQDLQDGEIHDAVLADYIVRDLRLLMVENVRILRKHVVVEAHKRR